MARPHTSPVDPAADAAALLRRLACAILMVALPVAALLSRRAVVILVPIGTILLVIAAIVDEDRRDLARRSRALLGPGGIAGLVALGWCGLSLLWTPFLGQAVDRYFNLVLTVALGIAGYLALPERMRSANLYLVTVGTGLAGLTAIVLALLLDPPGARATGSEPGSLERGLLVLVMLVWPAVGWLRSRNRSVEALLLAALAAAAAGLGSPGIALAAFACGALAFVVTLASPAAGVRAFALGMAGLLILAPLIPFLVEPIATAMLGRSSGLVTSLMAWRDVVVSEPLRLITGHGFETALRGRFVGLLPQASPYTLLFEVWYELGVVGALAGGVALYRSVLGVASVHPVLLPGMVAGFTTAYALACLGVGTAQAWWFTTLVATVLIFVATERGQFRTTRPKALLSWLRPATR